MPLAPPTLATARIPSLLLFIFILIVSEVLCRRALKGKVWEIARLPVIDAIDNAVGRATEMGKPLLYWPGSNADLNTQNMPQTIATLQTFGYVAGLCANVGTRIIPIMTKPESLPLMEEALQGAFAGAGKADEYDPKMIYLFPATDASPHTATVPVAGLIGREKPAAVIQIGAIQAECFAIAESGARVGAMLIGGTARVEHISSLALLNEYAILGEEVFVVGSYLSKDPVGMAAILSLDLTKIVLIAATVLLALLVNLGVKV